MSLSPTVNNAGIEKKLLWNSAEKVGEGKFRWFLFSRWCHWARVGYWMKLPVFIGSPPPLDKRWKGQYSDRIYELGNALLALQRDPIPTARSLRCQFGTMISVTPYPYSAKKNEDHSLLIDKKQYHHLLPTSSKSSPARKKATFWTIIWVIVGWVEGLLV